MEFLHIHQYLPKERLISSLGFLKYFHNAHIFFFLLSTVFKELGNGLRLLEVYLTELQIFIEDNFQKLLYLMSFHLLIAADF